MIKKILCVAMASVSLTVLADAGDFQKGPVLNDFGRNAKIAGVSLPADSQFKVAFDMSEANKRPGVNRGINSLARFINMHVRHGVKPENIQLALVAHGKGIDDLLKPEVAKARNNQTNGSAKLVQQLLDAGVQFYVCGQSAAHYEISQSDLIDGVQMSLSAMTAHAQLQQQGFTLNPF